MSSCDLQLAVMCILVSDHQINDFFLWSDGTNLYKQAHIADSQTFLIWFPHRVLKCAGSGWGRWGRSGWGVWLVGSPRKHRGKAVGSNGNSMKQCCVAKRSYKELINFLSCFPRIGPTACAGPSWQSNLDSTHCPHEAPRPRETIERPEKKHWWSWWLDGQNLGSWEFLVRP